ncbi:uncharacterized protein LOC144728960 isoform X1 [Lampetra planeri]
MVNRPSPPSTQICFHAVAVAVAAQRLKRKTAQNKTMEHSVLHLLHSVFIFYLTLSDAQIPGGQENNSSRPQDIHCVTRNSKTTSPSAEQIVVTLCERVNKSGTPSGAVSRENLLSNLIRPRLPHTQQAPTSQPPMGTANPATAHIPGTFEFETAQPGTEQQHTYRPSLNSQPTPTHTRNPNATQPHTHLPGEHTPESPTAHTLQPGTDTTTARAPATFTPEPTARSQSVHNGNTTQPYTSHDNTQGRTRQPPTSQPYDAHYLSSPAPIIRTTLSADSDTTTVDKSITSDNTTPPLSLFTSKEYPKNSPEDASTTHPAIFQTPTPKHATAFQARPPQAIDPHLLFGPPSFSYETFDFEMEENVAGVGNESGVAQYRQAEPCDVDPCHHPQPPCRATWQRGGCPCDTSPVRLTAPRLLAVVPVSESDVEVRWCSPRSSVRAFAVAYRAVDGEPAHNAGSSLLVHATWRSHVLRGLRANGRYQVCVAAIGRSGRSRCWETERSFGDADAAAAATAEFTAPAGGPWRLNAAIVAAVFLVELGCIAVLSLCLHRVRKARGRREPPPPPPAMLISYSSTEFLSVRNQAFLEIKDELACPPSLTCPYRQ